MRRQSSLHIIPATILAAGLVLTIKVGSIWQAVSGAVQTELVAVASAGEKPDETEPKLQAKASAEAPPGRGGAATPAAAPAETAPDSAAGLGRAGVPYSSAEIELLQKLSKRREELDRRERELDMREGLLKAAEQKLEAKSAALTALRKKIQGLIRDYDEQESRKLESLVKIYERMKSDDAARIMNELDMDVLLDVMQRMRESKAAPILADMEPARAREVTARLAERGSLAEHGSLPETDDRS